MYVVILIEWHPDSYRSWRATLISLQLLSNFGVLYARWGRESFTTFMQGGNLNVLCVCHCDTEAVPGCW